MFVVIVLFAAFCCFDCFVCLSVDLLVFRQLFVCWLLLCLLGIVGWLRYLIYCGLWIVVFT